jgi:DNA-binding protein Fis
MLRVAKRCVTQAQRPDRPLRASIVKALRSGFKHNDGTRKPGNP